MYVALALCIIGACFLCPKRVTNSVQPYRRPVKRPMKKLMPRKSK